MELAVGLALVVAGILFYLLPSIVSINRRVAGAHTGIVLVNLLLGWTVLGWIAALIWACTAETQAQKKLREMAYAQMAYGQHPVGFQPPVYPPSATPAPSSMREAGRSLGSVFRRDGNKA